MKTIRQYAASGILAVLGLVIIALVCMMFWYLRVIFLYIVIAAILTTIARPVEKWMEKIRIGKRKIARWLRALIVLLGIYLVIFLFIAIFIPLFVHEAQILSNVDTTRITNALHEPLAKLESIFSSAQPSGNQQTLEQYVQHVASDFLGITQVTSLANGIVSFIGKILMAFFIISFFTFFFIKDGPVIYETLLLLIPAKHVQSARNIVDDTRLMLSKYFTGVLLDVLFVTTFVSLGMLVIGVKNALIIGFFAGIMNIIPYVGPLIGASFGIIIGISTCLDLDFSTGILPVIEKIVIVFILSNLIDAFLVQPYIFSKRVRAHPIEIFAVILVAGTLAGVGGMIAAVPVYTVLRIIAREFLSKSRFVQKLTDELDEAAEQNKLP